MAEGGGWFEAAAADLWNPPETEAEKRQKRLREDQLKHAFEMRNAKSSAETIALDPDLGQALNKQLSEVQDKIDRMERQVRVLSQRTGIPLGGGYAEVIGKFMNQFAAGSDESVDKVLARSRREIEKFKQVIDKAMQNYRDTDQDAAQQLRRAGEVG